MKKALFFLFFLAPIVTFCQNQPDVTAAMGSAYAGGTFTATQINPSGQSQNVSAFFDGSGNLSIFLAPGSVQQVRFCTSSGLTCGQASFAVLGSATAPMSITTILTGASSASGGAALAGNANAIYASPACPVVHIAGSNCYFVYADTQFCFATNVAMTNGQPTVSCSASGINFLSPNVTGEYVFATTGCCGQSQSTTGTVILGSTATTVLSVQSASSFTASANATNTCSSNTTCEFAVGHDDTANLAAAWTAVAALPNCGTLYLPSGAMMSTTGQFQTASNGCIQAGTSVGVSYGSGEQVLGISIASTQIIPTPWFNFATCSSGGLFGGSNFMRIRDWSIFGLGNGATGNNSCAIVNQGTESVAEDFQIVAWGSADTSLVGMVFNGLEIDTRVQGSGQIGCEINGGIAYAYRTVCNYSKNQGMNVTSGSTLYGFGSRWGATGATGKVQFINSGTYYGDGDTLSGTVAGITNDICLETVASSYTSIKNTHLDCSSGSTSIGLYNHGGTQVYIDTVTASGGTGGGNGSGIFQDSNGILTDLGHDVLSGSALINNSAGTSIVADGHSLQGTCTGTATSSQTLGLFGTGPNETTTTCTSTTIGAGIPMGGPRTVSSLVVTATNAGFSASSGVVTVLKNGSGTSITCTVGTGTSCVDNTHSVSFANGDLISINFTTQATETLAGVKAQVIWQ